MLELGGRHVTGLDETDVPSQPDDALPEALVRWVDDGLVEAEESDEEPLSEAEHPDVRDLALRLVSALWTASAAR